MMERGRNLTEEALRKIKVTEPKEGFRGEDYRLLVQTVNAALAANAPFVGQMLVVGFLFSQALAPHVKRHLEENNKGATGKVVNLTDEAKRSS
ncbi:MAG: hypothetical protein RQ862_02225 [Candidatus Caldarchaeales archaeon]|jgi:hypothetical protein|nr:hypothetical protein [Candidatus Caldarchaeales archaeon]